MPWGGFEVVRTLQTGGEAELYEVRRARADGFLQRAVVKQLSAEMSSLAEERERFAREARLLSLMSDPRIVRILDYGVEDGRPYQILELVDGLDLGALVHRRGPLPPQHALVVIGDVASAVQALHEATDAYGAPLKLTHNDLAPQNVLLAAGGHVKLIDLGRADDLSSRPSSWVHGRRPYLAPERLKGAPSAPESDIFAMGAMLGFLSLGHSPFEEPSAQAHLLAGRLPRLPRSLPDPIARVVLRCCHPEPRRRFSSALDLRRACEQVGTEVGPASVTLQRWLERDRATANPPDEVGPDPATAIAAEAPPSRRERMRGLFEVAVSVDGEPAPMRSTILPPGAAEVAAGTSRPRGPFASDVAPARRWAPLASVGKRGCGELFVALDRFAGSRSSISSGVPPGVLLLKVFEPGAVARDHLERELTVARDSTASSLLKPSAHGLWGARGFAAFPYHLGRPLGRLVRDFRREGVRLPWGFVRRTALDVAEAVSSLGEARQRAAFVDDHLISTGSIFVRLSGEVLLTELALATATERATLGTRAGRRISLTRVISRMIGVADGAPKALHRELADLARSDAEEPIRLAALRELLDDTEDDGRRLEVEALYRAELRAERTWLREAVARDETDEAPTGPGLHALETPREPLVLPEDPHFALSTIADQASPLATDDPTLPFGADGE